jgi:hypothetical protein
MLGWFAGRAIWLGTKPVGKGSQRTPPDDRCSTVNGLALASGVVVVNEAEAPAALHEERLSVVRLVHQGIVAQMPACGRSRPRSRCLRALGPGLW